MISDGERLPFRDESFDVVYSNGVLHHTPDTAGAIREVHRVLRPGGVRSDALPSQLVELLVRDRVARGVLGAEFLRGRSAEEIMSRVIEFSDHDARPLGEGLQSQSSARVVRMFKDCES
jgi:ubiquinone/menaquinone biosynthesis C-methylase UbiE